MTEQEAIALANSIAADEGWMWGDMIRAVHFSAPRLNVWLFGSRPYWIVTANYRTQNPLVRIALDDASGNVLWKGLVGSSSWLKFVLDFAYCLLILGIFEVLAYLACRPQ